MTSSRSFAAAAALAVALGSAAGAQEIPADSVLRDFEPTGDYLLSIDGEEATDARLYRSQRAGSALLVESSELSSPIVVLPRDRAVKSVPEVKVVHREGGTVDVLADADLSPLGDFRIEGRDVVFSVDGEAVRIGERPPLLGLQGVEEMFGYSSEYRYRADAYEPSAAMLRRLGEMGGSGTVRVFFGSWCPYCKEMVPRILRVAEELDGGPLEFEFFGLPRSFGSVPEAKREGITGVPTGVVYRNGDEVGRIEGADWKIPELSLKRILLD